jgi:hypothetical protein
MNYKNIHTHLDELRGDCFEIQKNIINLNYGIANQSLIKMSDRLLSIMNDIYCTQKDSF